MTARITFGTLGLSASLTVSSSSPSRAAGPEEAGGPRCRTPAAPSSYPMPRTCPRSPPRGAGFGAGFAGTLDFTGAGAAIFSFMAPPSAA